MILFFFLFLVYNCIKEELETTVASLVNNIRKKLVKDSKNPEVFNNKLNEMRDSVTTKYLQSFESIFESCKSDIAQFMSIPNNVLLKEDLPVKIGMKVDPIKVDEEIKKLENKCKVQKFMKEKIVEEMEEADSTIYLIEKFLDDKEFKFDILSEESVKALSELAAENVSLVS